MLQRHGQRRLALSRSEERLVELDELGILQAEGITLSACVRLLSDDSAITGYPSVAVPKK